MLITHMFILQLMVDLCIFLLFFFFFFKQKTAYEMLRSLVGSEMCIRDSSNETNTHQTHSHTRHTPEDGCTSRKDMETPDHGARVTLACVGLPAAQFVRCSFQCTSDTWQRVLDLRRRLSGSGVSSACVYPQPTRDGFRSLRKTFMFH
eukprot:TRINITY_DN6456_c0_g1_i1.p1 TRINITY_DN6456_c0_g1~~TRINITY_DN6456_c0_g1_i1.p1  ORF type:complete len:148 (-),score=19.02 TRINITY_DN6456_c0_g1_i1:380-823(-)